MAFDKTSAKRNAEKYLAQGKIRAAIAEYKSVVQNDSRDYVTLNTLGDLCVKENDTAEALKCYKTVAEHYAKQGFAAKAIAIYNKVARIKPDSAEITEKLAELHLQKGAVGEAKMHYTDLAKSLERSGRKLDSLNIWKKIAEFDTSNTSVLRDLGESYLAEGENEEAIDAFLALGERFASHKKLAEAADAFQRVLSIEERNQRALLRYCETKQAAGEGADAIELLNGILESDPNDREASKLLVECYVHDAKPADAERILLKLAEFESGHHDLFLKLGEGYLQGGDVAGAARALSLSADALLVNGKGESVFDLATKILEVEPNQVEALRAICDFYTWQRDDLALQECLQKLADAARRADSIHEERFALSQLVLILPQETAFADRLRELNEKHGFETEEFIDDGFESLYKKMKAGGAAPQAADTESQPIGSAASFAGFELSNGDVVFEPKISEVSDSVEAAFAFETAIPVTTAAEAIETGPEPTAGDPDARLHREIESIQFYFENGYLELAQKAAEELRSEFGNRPEIASLFVKILGQEAPVPDEVTVEEPVAVQAPIETVVEVPDMSISGSFDLDQLRNELGIEDEQETRDADYETHYHMAIAYQEMGLLEQAINEFQSAVGLVSLADGTRRFFQCSNLLGHCFMQMGRPNLALKWYQRTLETPGLTDDEKQALWYEVANAFEAEGDHSNAARYFEMVYAENINFRDVGERLRCVAVPA